MCVLQVIILEKKQQQQILIFTSWRVTLVTLYRGNSLWEYPCCTDTLSSVCGHALLQVTIVILV